jgi:hypothetical protein
MGLGQKVLEPLFIKHLFTYYPPLIEGYTVGSYSDWPRGHGNMELAPNFRLCHINCAYVYPDPKDSTRPSSSTLLTVLPLIRGGIVLVYSIYNNYFF